MRVTTTRMKLGYFRRNGVPYGPNATMTEWFTTLSEPDGNTYLLVTKILEDRAVPERALRAVGAIQEGKRHRRLEPHALPVGRWRATTGRNNTMRLCRFGEGRLGLVEGGSVRDVTAALDVLPPARYPFPRHDALVANLDAVRARVSQLAPSAPALPLRRPDAAQPGRQPRQDRRGAGELPEAPGRGAGRRRRCTTTTPATR